MPYASVLRAIGTTFNGIRCVDVLEKIHGGEFVVLRVLIGGDFDFARSAVEDANKIIKQHSSTAIGSDDLLTAIANILYGRRRL